MKGKKYRGLPRSWGKYGICMVVGCFLYGAAELSAIPENPVKNGMLERKDCGEGTMSYALRVSGLEEKPVSVSVEVPERKLSNKEFEACIPEASKLLLMRILEKNRSLSEVRTDLNLVKTVPEYGLSVSWSSEKPELVSDIGILGEEIPEEGDAVYLKARLSNGGASEEIEIPVTVLPLEKTASQRLQETLEEAVLAGEEAKNVPLPKEFEGHVLSYEAERPAGNESLLLLGVVAAVCLYLKERKDGKQAQKRREESLLRDYPELVSGFLLLTGAGYPVRQAWKKQVADFEASPKTGFHPVYEEMRLTWNQMETGMAEVQAYGEFGRRIGLGNYRKLSSLLSSSVRTGGRDLRKLLEAEMETAFSQRKDMALRKGEEASTKLLFPMFLMLGVVMVMVAAPAFLTLG